jgi:hypothetical protein
VAAWPRNGGEAEKELVEGISRKSMLESYLKRNIEVMHRIYHALRNGVPQVGT